MILFADRAEAGRKLAGKLAHLDPAGSVILALPRGGVAVAAEICAATGAPLDLVLVRKIGAPGQTELAVGAVTDGAEPHYAIVREVADAFGLSDEEVKRRGEKELAEIERRRALWFGARPRMALAGRTAVVVDDGVATGATLRAALDAVRAARPARLVLALPVAPDDVLPGLARLADDTICLATPRPFHAVGAHYRSFPQLADRDVVAALEKYAPAEGRQGNAAPLPPPRNPL